MSDSEKRPVLDTDRAIAPVRGGLAILASGGIWAGVGAGLGALFEISRVVLVDGRTWVDVFGSAGYFAAHGAMLGIFLGGFLRFVALRRPSPLRRLHGVLTGLAAGGAFSVVKLVSGLVEPRGVSAAVDVGLTMAAGAIIGAIALTAVGSSPEARRERNALPGRGD
jgi:hypothetical protein